MAAGFSYNIFPLGDTAISIDFGNRISLDIHDQVMSLYHRLDKDRPLGITDIVPAYSSLTLHYDPAAWLPQISKEHLVFDLLKALLIAAVEDGAAYTAIPARTMKIPVCYEAELAPDLAAVAAHAGLKSDEVIRLHTAGLYQVYMLGFLPGFAYMGQVPEAIAAPRKKRPQNIAPGSVGIAGRQTGIYPLESPGGWQIIGRTPVSVFNPASGDVLLQPGDIVQFYPISRYEFEHY